MGCFCIGSYTRALLSCAVRGETQGTFCPKLFALLDSANKDYMTEDTIGQILGGAQNLNPDWRNELMRISSMSVLLPE